MFVATGSTVQITHNSVKLNSSAENSLTPTAAAERPLLSPILVPAIITGGSS